MAKRPVSLIPQLRKLRKELSINIGNLNFGGCAVAASAVINRLAAMDIEVWGIAAGDEWFGQLPDVESVRSELPNNLDPQEWDDNGLAFNHVGAGFIYKGAEWTWDSWEGVGQNKKEIMHYPIYTGKFTPEEMQAFADDGGYWNSRYDREQNPRVHEIVDEILTGDT